MTFVDGVSVGKVSDAQARYFRRHGYLRGDTPPPVVEPLEAEPAPPLLVVDGMPKRSASTAAWQSFAVAKGMAEETAAGMSRAELVALYSDGAGPVA